MRLAALALWLTAGMAVAELPAAVGRVEGGPWGHCTGVLVAADQVLVLASCLQRPLRGWADGARLTFRAGLTLAGAAAEGQGLRLVVHPSQDQSGFMPPGYFNNAALLVLAAPLPGVEPVMPRDAAAGRDYRVVHYPARDRDAAEPAVATCRAFPLRAPMRPYDCGETMGEPVNGAVVLDLGRGRPALAGLVEPRNRTNGGRWVETRDIGPALADLRALAAGRDPPRVLRGGQARSSHDLPGRIGITRP